MEFFIRDTPNTEPVPGIYAHNKAEQLCDSHQIEGEFCPPDLVAIRGEFPVLADGEHACTIHGVPAVLLFWTAYSENHGLIILIDDKDGLEFARTKLTKKSASL